MRKILALTLVALMAAGTIAVIAQDAGEITSATVQTHNRVALTFDGNASTYDSLYLAYRILNDGSSDTTFVAYLDSASTDTTLTSLTPSRVYEFMTIARLTGKTNLSDQDTLLTKRVPGGDRAYSAYMSRDVATDASWSLNDSYLSVDNTFDLSGADASDYSLIYYASEYNGLDVYATQAGDSTVASIYFHPVWVNGISPNDSTFWRDSAVADSVNVTSQGLTRSTVSLPVGRFYQMRVYTLLGNGKDADFKLRFYSNGAGGE